MVRILVFLILLLGITNPAFAISQQWNLILSDQKGVDHIGSFTIDTSLIPNLEPPSVLASNVTLTTVTSVNLNFLGQYFNDTNFGGVLQFPRAAPNSSDICCADFFGGGTILNFGMLSIFGGDFQGPEYGPLTGGQWVFETYTGDLASHGTVRTQLTPEPSTWVLFATGLIGVLGLRKFRAQSL